MQDNEPAMLSNAHSEHAAMQLSMAAEPSAPITPISSLPIMVCEIVVKCSQARVELHGFWLLLNRVLRQLKDTRVGESDRIGGVFSSFNDPRHTRP